VEPDLAQAERLAVVELPFAAVTVMICVAEPVPNFVTTEGTVTVAVVRAADDSSGGRIACAVTVVVTMPTTELRSAMRTRTARRIRPL
jgi:hypothetical protein